MIDEDAFRGYPLPSWSNALISSELSTVRAYYANHKWTEEEKDQPALTVSFQRLATFRPRERQQISTPVVKLARMIITLRSAMTPIAHARFPKSFRVSCAVADDAAASCLPPASSSREAAPTQSHLSQQGLTTGHGLSSLFLCKKKAAISETSH
jgi:hypothetical protein